MTPRLLRAVPLALLLALLCPFTLAAQQPEPAEVVIEPDPVVVHVGESLQLRATVKDEAGNVLDVPVLFFSTSRRELSVSSDGLVSPAAHGAFEVVVIVPDAEQQRALLQRRFSVTVPAPPVVGVELGELPEKVYAGSRLQLTARALDDRGNARGDVEFAYASSDEAVARVDANGRLQLLAAGPVAITASTGEVSTSRTLDVGANPVAAVGVVTSASAVRTGDVVHVTAQVLDAAGVPVTDVPIEYSVSGEPGDRGLGATAQITADGRFVAEAPGVYSVSASAGGRIASSSIAVTPRNVQRQVELVGRGRVVDQHTSDLWVWKGGDGRDYAITGTWGADGHAIIWDVTDAADMRIVERVQVDARTVNDVKVSADGRIAVISREGASNRRNGLVILDVSDPANGVPVVSSYDDELTGGVHNVFLYEEHVYALSGGQRYDIINIEDPANPHRVGRFELETPGHSIHDVWVEDGIAYSSNWTDGVVAVDVGGGGKGGSPRNPVMLGSYAYPSGWNHAAFPYTSQSTGHRYAFAGDEAFPYGLNAGPGSTPTRAAGWVHVIEWDEWDNPREVARYEVPEAGTHNLWVEDDILYVAYYNGGLRVVDVSGELMGDLYRQGREIARYIPEDPEGYSPNAPMVWGPQPYDGKIFFSDWNTGLWAIRLLGPDADGS